MPDNVLWRLNGYGTMGTMRLNEPRVGPFFWTILFGPFHKGGEHTISTKGSVGCSLLVPREG